MHIDPTDLDPRPRVRELRKLLASTTHRDIILSHAVHLYGLLRLADAAMEPTSDEQAAVIRGFSRLPGKADAPTSTPCTAMRVWCWSVITSPLTAQKRPGLLSMCPSDAEALKLFKAIKAAPPRRTRS